MDGTPNFRPREVAGISFFTPDIDTLFVERDPFSFFETQRKEDWSVRGYGDIQYNLGVAPNVEGVFSLRGLCNKSAAHTNRLLNSTHVSILVLLGTKEQPTDLLLQNIVNAQKLVTGKWPEAVDVKGTLPVGDFFSMDMPKESSQFKCGMTETFSEETGVHVFELVETLAYWNYFRGRNDGTYNELVRQAVRELQADLKEGNLYLKRIDGKFGRYTREAFCLYLKQLRHS
jgi:hypothetical protein